MSDFQNTGTTGTTDTPAENPFVAVYRDNCKGAFEGTRWWQWAIVASVVIGFIVLLDWASYEAYADGAQLRHLQSLFPTWITDLEPQLRFAVMSATGVLTLLGGMVLVMFAFVYVLLVPSELHERHQDRRYAAIEATSTSQAG